jgi:hypothetical protein
VWYPGQQKKAQQEIDKTFNVETLPDFSEMKHSPHSFPLTEGVIKSVVSLKQCLSLL